MSYAGTTFVIPFGQAGLVTDGAQSNIPSNALIRANNVTFYDSVIQKDYGSRIWNSTPLPDSVVRGFEMFVDSGSQQQRVFALCADGQIYKLNNYFTQTKVTPSSISDPASLNTDGYNCMVAGGNEVPGNPKKLFIFDGHNTPQVVTADGVTRRNMTKPAADWTGTNQPIAGMVYRGRMLAWGCPNNPHFLYMSNVSDHEDFTTSLAINIFNVYPGEGDLIVCAQAFRGTLFLFKYPIGLYYLVDMDPSAANWYIAKHSDDFGACSPQSCAITNDNMIVANNYGSLTSMTAALVYGDLLNKDVFYQLYNYRFAQQEVRPDIIKSRSLIYYAAKRQLMSSFQSNIGNKPDRISVLDFRDQSTSPKSSWTNKDQPNCLFTIRDNTKVARPFYGASDGNIYQMDSEDRWVGSASDTTKQSAYLFEAQTPHMDFGQGNIYSPGTGNATLAAMNKLYDFLEIEYEPTGDWDVQIDVFVDGRLIGTYSCNLSARSTLGEMPLNASPIDGRAGFFRRFPLNGTGRVISLRFYNNGLGQNVRLARAIFYYRLSENQQLVG